VNHVIRLQRVDRFRYRCRVEARLGRDVVDVFAGVPRQHVEYLALGVHTS